MLIGLFGVLGLVVGLAIDALIERLAWPPEDEDELEAEAQFASNGLAAEAGELVVADTTSSWTRRLAVMAVTSALFGLTAWRYEGAAELAIVATYVAVLVLCAGTDLISYRVPNVVTYPAMVGAIVIGALMPDAEILNVLAGGALAGGVLLVPSLLTGGIGMGMGDVKLAAFVGLAVGLSFVAPALLVMAIGGGLTALFLLLSGIRKKGEPIPYAPFIAIGGLAVMFWQGTAFASL